MDQNLNTKKEAQAVVEQVFPKQKKPGRMALQIFAILVLLGLVGWGVYASQNNRVAELEQQVTELKKETPVAKEVTTDSYKGWKAYTTKYEKLSFKYPETLTLAYSSTPGDLQQITPGTEIITLTSKSGLRLKIWNGVDGVGGGCEGCKILKNDTLSFLGATNYLNYLSRSVGLISSIEVATDKAYNSSGMYKSKNVTIDQTGGPTINLYNIGYGNGQSETIAKPLAIFVADPALADMKLVLESFKY